MKYIVRIEATAVFEIEAETAEQAKALVKQSAEYAAFVGHPAVGRIAVKAALAEPPVTRLEPLITPPPSKGEYGKEGPRLSVAEIHEHLVEHGRRELTFRDEFRKKVKPLMPSNASKAEIERAENDYVHSKMFPIGWTDGWRVEHSTAFGWQDAWTDDGKPVRFASEAEAEKELAEFLAQRPSEVKSEYRVTPVPVLRAGIAAVQDIIKDPNLSPKQKMDKLKGEKS